MIRPKVGGMCASMYLREAQQASSAKVARSPSREIHACWTYFLFPRFMDVDHRSSAAVGSRLALVLALSGCSDCEQKRVITKPSRRGRIKRVHCYHETPLILQRLNNGKNFNHSCQTWFATSPWPVIVRWQNEQSIYYIIFICPVTNAVPGTV